LNDPNCGVCGHVARDIIEQFLFIGFAYPEIPKEIGEPPEFAQEIRSHHFQRHVEVDSITPEAYTFMLVRYAQDVRFQERRELQKSSERQSESKLKRCDAGKQFVITRIAQLKGFDKVDRRVQRSAAQVLAEMIKSSPKLEHKIKAVTVNAGKTEEVV
jgi:hypothetical protein